MDIVHPCGKVYFTTSIMDVKCIFVAMATYSLQDIAASDIHHIHKGLSDVAVTKYYDVHFETLEATKEQMEWYADLEKNGTGKWWRIVDDATSVFCGACGYNALSTEHRRAEMGLWLLPEYWGKGIMGKVLPDLIQAGYEGLNLNRIEAYVVSDNEKCKKALAKTVFSHEGRHRDYEIVDDQPIDVDVYALLKQDWEATYRRY